MVSFVRFIELLSRSPSLRGYSMGPRISSGKTRSVRSAIERSTLGKRRVHLVRPFFGSAVGLAFKLQEQGLNYEAVRLRSGDVCFVTDYLNAPEMPVLGRSHLGRQLGEAQSTRRGQWFGVGSVLIGVSVLVGAYFVGDASELSQPQTPVLVNSEGEMGPSVISASQAPSCSQALDAPEDVIVGFLESGAIPENLDIIALSTLENGGIRGVIVSVSCLADPGATEAEQKWRVSLTKSGLSWKVTKMTRLTE